MRDTTMTGQTCFQATVTPPTVARRYALDVRSTRAAGWWRRRRPLTVAP
ncbi:MAG: hypothetical protein U0531_09780 [Dehalococcoidia bacterium]